MAVPPVDMTDVVSEDVKNFRRSTTRQVANFSDDPRKKKNSYKIFHVHNYWKKYNQRLTKAKRKKEKDVNQRKKLQFIISLIMIKTMIVSID
jgi:hypothetical protein